MTGNIKRWNDFTNEDLDEVKHEVDKGGTGFLKLEIGQTVLRFLPPTGSERTPFAVAHQHFLEVPGGNTTRVNCARLMQNQPCPVCQLADRLKSTGNREDYALGDSMYAGKRVFANVIDRASPDLGPQVLAFGKKIFDELDKILRDGNVGGNFTDPTEAGFDIVIEREGTGKQDTKYSVHASRQNSALAATDEEIDAILAAKNSLVELTAMLDYDETSKMIVQAYPKVFANAVVGQGRIPAPSRQLAPTPAAPPSAPRAPAPAPAPAARGRTRSTVEDKAFAGK